MPESALPDTHLTPGANLLPGYSTAPRIAVLIPCYNEEVAVPRVVTAFRAALPGATVLQLDDRGIERVEWQDLDLVDHWRRYLGDPRAYLRHVVE